MGNNVGYIVNALTGTEIPSIVDLNFEELAVSLKKRKQTLKFNLKQNDCEVVVGLEDEIPIFIIDMKSGDIITGAFLTTEKDKNNFVSKSIDNGIDEDFVEIYKKSKLNSLIFHSSLDTEIVNEKTVELIAILLLTLKTKLM